MTAAPSLATSRECDAEAAAAIVAPSFAPEAAAVVRRHIELAGDGNLECSFICGWDAERQMIVSAELVTRGAGFTTFTISTDARPGTLELHNHPAGLTTFLAPSPLIPSPEDVTSAIAAAKRGVGSAICDNECRRLVVLREPREIRPRAAWSAKAWHVGSPLTTPAQLVEELTALVGDVGPVSVVAQWEPRP